MKGHCEGVNTRWQRRHGPRKHPHDWSHGYSYCRGSGPLPPEARVHGSQRVPVPQRGSAVRAQRPVQALPPPEQPPHVQQPGASPQGVLA